MSAAAALALTFARPCPMVSCVLQVRTLSSVLQVCVAGNVLMFNHNNFPYIR